MNTLEHKISNLKTLLHYLPNSEAIIDNDITSNFFIDFFTKSKFHDPDYGMIIIGNYLESISKVPTLFIKYEYNWDRDGCDTEIVLFKDNNAEYKQGHGMYGKSNAINTWERGDFEYSDIPENIWDIIINIVYKKAKENINYEIIEAKRHYENCLNEFSEFNKLDEQFKKE